MESRSYEDCQQGVQQSLAALADIVNETIPQALNTFGVSLFFPEEQNKKSTPFPNVPVSQIT
jgi:hypothetical protein